MTHPPPRDLRELPCGHLVSIEGDSAQCYFHATRAIEATQGLEDGRRVIVLIGACDQHFDELHRRFPDAPQHAVPR